MINEIKGYYCKQEKTLLKDFNQKYADKVADNFKMETMVYETILA